MCTRRMTLNQGMGNFMKNDFHYYKGQDLSKFEKVERRVIELLLTSDVPDSKREDSLLFEIKHAAGCTQIARILAQKRGLDVEIADVAATLHDISVVVSGIYKDHAQRGGPIAEEILRQVGGFTPAEIQTITLAVVHHSEKDVYSTDPYIELVKDVDVLDCSLYKGGRAFYSSKSQQIFKDYEKRLKNIRKELGLNPEKTFR